ncbi:MAG: DUF402 domain-containing protein [Desulfurococcus sp.]|nr:DUF402 domain-containing protein [Desulfurococcus sp.]
MIRVRVRGIYSTAITKMLAEKGYRIVQASEKIMSRLGLSFDNSPSDVTVKDSDDGDGVIVVGFPAETREVFDYLTNMIPYTIRALSKIELYSVYLAKVEENKGGECTVDAGDFKAQVTPCSERPGGKLIIGVRRAPLYPGERIIVSRSFRLTGRLVALIHGDSRVYFSKHIRDPELKARLTAIAASRIAGSGLGVHFRSSSRFAGVEDVRAEIDFLLGEYSRLLSRARDSEPPLKLYSGELVGYIGFTSLSKSFLDEVRNTIVPTVIGHHSLRSMNLGDLVELAEHAITYGCDRSNISRSLLEYVLLKIREKNVIHIRHIKPTGEVLELTPGRIESVVEARGSRRILVKRVIAGGGFYDGLNVEKKPGDVDYALIPLGESFISHNYYRDGVWLGSYINVNTPPEVSPGLLKYHDLLVDVVVSPQLEARIIDVDRLEDACSKGLLSHQLCDHAMKTAESIARDPALYLYNPASLIQ